MDDDHRPRGRERRANPHPASLPITRQNGTRIDTDARNGVDRRTLGFISTFQLFRGVPYSLVEHVVAAGELREFPDTAVLLRRGDINSHVALVVSGRLRIHLDAPDSDDFFEIAPGECVGEMSIIDGQPVSAYVVADSGCRLLLLEGSAFLSQVLIIPEVARNLMTAFAERMRINNARIIKRARAAMELQRLQRELRFARTIQAGMMPTRSPLFPERSDVDGAGHMSPAREVGGDFYDAFFVDDDTLFIAIGDVCGKGMPAALLMARTITVLRGEASRRPQGQRPDIRLIMERVNTLLCANNESQMFTSVFAALLALKSGALSYVNAGHNPPLLALNGGAFNYLEEPRNPVVGIRNELIYRAGQANLLPDSSLILYTDGITEAETASGERFGENRLLAALNQSRRASAGSIIDETLSAVTAFIAGNDQTDDITLLALRYLG